MNTILPFGPTYSDARGVIEMVIENADLKSVSTIMSKPNTTRASHWHKKDSHYCLVLEGEIWYYERPVGSTEKPKMVIVETGQLFYTPPGVEHEMFFPQHCVFICFSTLARTNECYESDTTRLTEKLKDIYDK